MKNNEYFDIIEYIKDVKIEDYLLEHLSEVELRFDDYLKNILSYEEDELLTLLTIELFNELLFSDIIENNKILSPVNLIDKGIIMTTDKLSHDKICSIQKSVLEHSTMPYPLGEYREVDVFIKNNGEVVYNAPAVNLVNDFMNKFIEFYNMDDNTLIHNDPFIKSSLIQLLFIKIHPFVDGNGRVSRILHNMKFTELVNKTYLEAINKDLKLKLPPINISYSIYNNKKMYYKRLNDIEFFKGAQISSLINRWLEFILYMYEEQLYYIEHSNNVRRINQSLAKIKKKNI